MLPRSVLVTNSKGGVGKSSISSHLAAMAAEAGYAVLCLDVDPQGNLSRDFGVFGVEGIDDSGQGLLEAIQFGRPVSPVKDVRPGLDLVPGGPYVEDAVKVAPNLAGRGRDPRMVLNEALAPLAENYHLIVIDSPPGDRYLQDIAMCAAQYVLIPTRSDEASLDGLSRTADAFVKAREVNQHLELLGVVLFGIGASSTAIQRTVRNKVTSGLGTVAPVFEAQIRYLEAPAVAARDRGMLVHEYERDLVDKAPKWYELRKANGKHRDRAGSNDRVATTAHKLAGDYAALTTQVLTELQRRTNVQHPQASAGGRR